MSKTKHANHVNKGGWCELWRAVMKAKLTPADIKKFQREDANKNRKPRKEYKKK